jgi:hypothetical protein
MNSQKQQISSFNKRIPKSTLHRHMRQKLKITSKSINHVALNGNRYRGTPAEKHFYLQIGSLILQNYNLIYIDETSFNIQMARNIGFSIRGTKAVKHKVNRQRGITMITAMSQHKIIGIMLVDGYATALVYSIFLKELAEKLF